MNCHLLVPDLLHAAGGNTGLYGGLALPALEMLLARGRATALAGASLERWLAHTFHIGARPDLPLAALTLVGDGIDPGKGCWLQADPVHLSVHRDELLLTNSGRLRPTTSEANALTSALNSHFAEDGLEFIAPTPERWYVRAREEQRIRTTPTAEAIGRRIEPLLPQGEDGARWRRIVNEAQMLLHDHPSNDAREERGELPVNSVWPWGAGRLPEIPGDAPYDVLWSSNALATGIASVARLQVQPVPLSGAPFLEAVADRANGKPLLLILDGLRTALAHGPDAWRTTLGNMETQWFSPLAAGLKRGLISSLTLHVLGPEYGRTVAVARFDPLKFWRPRRALGHYAV